MVTGGLKNGMLLGNALSKIQDSQTWKKLVMKTFIDFDRGTVPKTQYE
jgi:hypothetical protein